MRNVIPGFIVGLVLIFTAIAYPELPERIITHWSLDGQPDGWSSRAVGAWLMPAVMFFVWALMRVLPKIDPRRENYAAFQHTYTAIITVVIALMAVMHVALIGAALGWPISIPRLMPMLIGSMLVIVGNLLPRARPNWFVGIRTPWTLSSDRVWEKTHRLGGVLFIICGLVLVAASFGPERLLGPAIVSSVLLGAAVPVLYSLVLWLRERRGSAGSV